MSVDRAPALRSAAGPGPVRPLAAGQLLLVATAVVACALAYGFTVLSAYLADGLVAGPLSQAGGGTYPDGLPVRLSATADVVGALAIVVTPFVAFGGAVLTGTDLVPTRGRGARAALPSVLVLLLCVAVMGAYVAVGPVTSWYLD